MRARNLSTAVQSDVTRSLAWVTANPSGVVLPFLVAFVFAVPVPARAQSHARVALGVDTTQRLFADDHFGRDEGLKPSFLYRIRKDHRVGNGWRFKFPDFGFNWGSTHVTQSVGGADTPLGRLRLIGFGAGAAEALVLNDGKDELAFSLIGGPAFSHFSLSDEARAAYRQRLNAESIDVHVNNTWFARLAVSYWHDISARVGFHSSVSYIVARPHAITRTPVGETRTRWKTDHLALKAGLAVGIF
jgi:hypothetical protein